MVGVGVVVGEDTDARTLRQIIEPREIVRCGEVRYDRKAPVGQSDCQLLRLQQNIAVIVADAGLGLLEKRFAVRRV